MAYAPDPRYFDAKTPRIEKSLWPSSAKPPDGIGPSGNHFYLVNAGFNGRKICWGTVIERK